LHGFYIDVGAHHPWHLSNTYKLYWRGCCGITIEPNPDVAALFARRRPRDLHLTCGIARERAELTSFDGEQANRMAQQVVERIRVACLPLQDVVDQHRTEGGIDFVSVDCEGLDLDVLSSLDWTRVRPTAVIVEDFGQFTRNKDGTSLKSNSFRKLYSVSSTLIDERWRVRRSIGLPVGTFTTLRAYLR
jgi:FkbM family methyltransferase